MNFFKHFRHFSRKMHIFKRMTREEALEKAKRIKENSAALAAETDSILQKTEENHKKLQENLKEELRVTNVLSSADAILNRLENDFEEGSSLGLKDIPFLVVATSLQLLRIYLLPQIQESFKDSDRLDHNDPKIKQMEREKIEAYKKEHSDWKSVKSKKNYRSWQEIAFTRKVPYDATRHSGDGFNGINMHGSLHRVKTLGHDPILGWIFGTANILTDSITVTPEYELGEKKLPIPWVQTYSVDMGSNFCWKERISTPGMFADSFESTQEDWHRLAAALFAQGLHLASDEYTKAGLPIPFLSTIAPEEAYKIYSKGIDYLHLTDKLQIVGKTIKSASQAIAINQIIGFLHTLLYNPNTDRDQQLYSIRTRKIILLSNTIATASDVIQTAMRAYNGDESALKNFDFGGFIVTIYRLITDIAFIQEIRDKFVFGEWERIVMNKDNIYNI